MMTHQNFLVAEKARASAFNIFTALLCQPEKEVITHPKVFDTLISSLKIVCPDCVSDATSLKRIVNDYTPVNLLVEYTRLFIGPSKMVAPPYSSIYFGTEYTLMSDETLWVMRFYEKMGLRYDEKLKEVPDHVAIETEFMYHMIFLELKAFQKKDMKKAKKIWKSQSEFFNRHYKKWVPAFCDKIDKGSQHEYFKLISKCLKKFVLDTPVPAFPEKINKR